jgi:Holliday junction resolvase RusA-like endonuclease
MAKGDIHIVNLPYFLTIGKKRYSCNLNQYRNAHYRLTNAMKKQFKDEITDEVLALPENMQQVKIHYKVFYENKRKFDLDNVVSVISKFAQDALVELGRLPDDNYEHIVQITGTFGGVDRENPRVEMRIKEI